MARSTKSKSRPTKAKKPLENLPGRIFSDIEEEYIIYLKEAHTPTLNWQELTDRFNERFPESARSKGGLQVHYSRSLQPGAKRRPRKIASRQAGNETTTSSSSAGDVNPVTLSNNVGQAPEVAQSGGSIQSPSSQPGTSKNISDPSSQLIVTQDSAVSQKKRQRSVDPSLRVSTDNTSAFFRDVDGLGHGRRTRRRVDNDRKYVAGSSTEDENVPQSHDDIHNPVVTNTNARPKAKPVSLKLKMSAAKEEVSKKAPSTKTEVSKQTTAAREEAKKSTDAAKEKAKKKPSSRKSKKEVPNRVEPVSFFEAITGATHTYNVEVSRGPVYMSGANGNFDANEIRPQGTAPTHSEESKSLEPPRRGWEVCVKGHKEWELARLGKMLQLWKNPPRGRVTLYCHKSGSFATRARRYDDPVESLTSGGPLQHHLKKEAADAKKKEAEDAKKKEEADAKKKKEEADAKKKSAAAKGDTEAKAATKGPATRKRARGDAELDEEDEIYQSGPSKKTKTAESSSKEQTGKPNGGSVRTTEAGKGAIKKPAKPRNRAAQSKEKAASKVSKTQPKKPAARKAASKLRQMMNAGSLSPVPEEFEEANRSGPPSTEHTTDPSNDSSNKSTAALANSEDNVAGEEATKEAVDTTTATEEAINGLPQNVANEPADAVVVTEGNNESDEVCTNPSAYEQ